jgi:RNA polymerase sigma-70 factor (ECF subfamily)
MMQGMTPRDTTATAPASADPAEWSALMARAQDGEAAAYRQLLLAITPYLRAIAARAHRNPDDVEDTVQDVLLSVHAVRHTYDPGRPFKPWLAGIARHRIIDRLRRQGKITANEIALEPEHETFARSATNVESQVLHGWALHAALRELPPGQQQAVMLLKIKGLSLKEATHATGLSIAALKVATHRGLKALRRMLQQGEDIQ